jgi:hypothetical protein
MGALTFTQALIEAESRARKTLPSTLHERLAHATELVRGGRVFQDSAGAWQVDSSSTEGLTYNVNGVCNCQDAHYNQPPKGLCKHRLAVYLSRKVQALMTVAQMGTQAPVPEGLTSSDTAPLYEAPASVNVRLLIDGRDCQLTLRDSDEGRLLARLAVVLQQYPVPQPAPQASSTGEGYCLVHETAMKLNEKNGQRWYSHPKPEGGWCRGRK